MSPWCRLHRILSLHCREGRSTRIYHKVVKTLFDLKVGQKFTRYGSTTIEVACLNIKAKKLCEPRFSRIFGLMLIHAASGLLNNRLYPQLSGISRETKTG